MGEGLTGKQAAQAGGVRMSNVSSASMGRMVVTFRSAIKQSNLHHIPNYLRDVLKDDAWRQFTFDGVVYGNQNFTDFLLRAPLGGCGFDSVEMVDELLEKAGDLEALRLFREAVAGRHGGGQGADVTLKSCSSSSSNAEERVVDQLLKWWLMASSDERARFMSSIGAGGRS